MKYAAGSASISTQKKRGCLARYSSIHGARHKAQGRVHVPRFPKQGSGLVLSYVRGTSTRNNPADTLSSHPSISPAPCTFLSPSGIFLRSPLLYVERGRLRGYIDRKPRCSMHAYGNEGGREGRGEGEGGSIVLDSRMQIPSVQGDMISSASPAVLKHRRALS